VNIGAPVKYNLILTEKLVKYFDCYYTKNLFGEIVIVMSATLKSNEDPLQSGSRVATLPEGFRPATTIEVPCVVGALDLFDRKPGTIGIDTSGALTVFSGQMSNISHVFFSCIFSTGNY